MAQHTSALVDYEPTSEEDNFTDSKSPGPSESFATRRRPSNTTLSSASESPTSGGDSEQSEFELEQGAQAAHSPPEVLTVNSSSEEEGERQPVQPSLSACRQEEGRDDLSAASDSDCSADDLPASPAPVDSSSEEEKPAAKRPRLQTASWGWGAQGRGAYVLKFRGCKC